MNPADGLKRGILNQTQGRLINATVIDVVRGRCSVRLASNGQTLHGIPYTGGPLAKGDSCKVDYSSGSPMALVMGRTADPGPKKRPMTPKNPVPEPPPPAEDLIRRYTEGALVATYEVTQEGLEECAGECEDDDLVVLPDMDLELTSRVEFNTAVTIRGQGRETSILRGGLILLKKATLTDCAIWPVVADSTEAVGVETADECKITDCDIHAVNCSTGNAVAIKNGGKTTALGSWITGESEAGAGYAVFFEGGTATLRDSQVMGTTADYSDDSKAYVYGTTIGEAVTDCPSAISNSLLGYDEYQFNPQAGYAMPSGSTATELSFRPWMHSKKYIYGVDPDGYITRLNLSDLSEQTINATIAFDERQDWTVFSDDVVYVFNQPANPSDECRLRKVDFSTGSVATTASWEQGDYAYNSLWKCGIIPYESKIVMFGCATDQNDKLKFFYRFYDTETETLGALNVVDLTGTTADDNFEKSFDLAGVVYGSDLVVLVCPSNVDTAPIVAAILDINLITEALVRTSSSVGSSYNQFQIDDNIVACAEGIVFKISGFSGAYSGLMRYDIAGHIITSLPITADDSDDIVCYGTRSKFYALVQDNANWVVKDITGAEAMDIPTNETYVPEHRTYPAIVDDRIWIIVNGKYTGYKIGNPNDKVEIQTPATGERFDDFMICEGYIIHYAANGMQLGDKYYLVK